MTAPATRAEVRNASPNSPYPGPPAVAADYRGVGGFRFDVTADPSLVIATAAVSFACPPDVFGPAKAAATAALDVGGAVAADERVVGASGRAERLRAALGEAREGHRAAGRTADQQAAAVRAALADGADPGNAEAARDREAVTRDRLAVRIAELTELLAKAERELEAARNLAEADALRALRDAYQDRLAAAVGPVGDELARTAAEIWESQFVLAVLANRGVR